MIRCNNKWSASRRHIHTSNRWEQRLHLTVGVNNYCKDCCVCVCSGRRSRSNLCVSGCRLCLCHSASHVEFTAPFGTAKKGKAAQVREVQPIAADPSSCSRPSRRWHATQHTPPAVAWNVSVRRLSLSHRFWIYSSGTEGMMHLRVSRIKSMQSQRTNHLAVLLTQATHIAFRVYMLISSCIATHDLHALLNTQHVFILHCLLLTTNIQRNLIHKQTNLFFFYKSVKTILKSVWFESESE